MPLEDNSMDFGYSLGVLHHVPDTEGGIKSCVKKLKLGAPFLIYLYYAFDNRPFWYYWLWTITDLTRRLISRMPSWLKYVLTQLIAIFVYFPPARIALVLEKLGLPVNLIPLSYYRNFSFYTMRTDALDRFGAVLEKRFTAGQIRSMMESCGLEQIVFSPDPPFWCALGYKKDSES